MTRAYAVGDIHGHLDKLKRAHALIAEDQARCGGGDAPVVHLGDLVDRGPDSRGVVQFLIDGRARGENWMVLKGNHDRLMSLYLRDPPERDPRLREGLDWAHQIMGGMDTVASYGVTADDSSPEQVHRAFRAAVPQAHVDFMNDLPTWFQLQGAFFCHAGIRPGVALEEQVEDDLIWIRQEFHQSAADHGALIVHGHTPIDAVTHYGNRVNLDTGAGWGRELSAVVIEGRDVWLLTGDGRVRVGPD